MAWIWTSLVLAILVFLLHTFTKKSSKTLPPGPRGLPILGSLLKLGAYPHRDLHKLAKQYGSIMYLRLGFVPVVVVSSPKAAESFLKTHDLVFASRPFNEAAKYITYDRTGLVFAEYGLYWRNLRKMCTLELLSVQKIDSFRSMRKEELGLVVESLKEAAKLHLPVDLSTKVFSLSMDMSCLMILGNKYMKSEDGKQKGFLTVVQEGMHLVAIPNIADYIPYIGILDIQGLAKRMKAVSRVFDDFFEQAIDEHLQEAERGHHRGDFVDIMLSFMNSSNEFKIHRPNIKAVMLDMIVGSMDTSATAIEWVLAELLKNPRIMKKVQQELESVVGLDRMVEESDIMNLQYLDMVVKESFRLHPVAPLLIPHESTEDCTVDGYHIPKKSRLIINSWAIGRDPSVWPDAGTFLPERFVENNVDIRGRHFQLLPFGSGRRGCPGMHLGITIVKFMVAQLVHCFDLELPNGMLPKELDMDEEFGLAMPRANHLSVIPTYRLNL